MKQFLDTVKVVVICIAVFCFAGFAFYMCEVVPMDECMKEGHSLSYCHKLLNRD